jgi:CubicO group peptidase (beta-lactamase class C family)
MDEWNVEAGLVGIMRNRRVVYLRGFGSMDAGIDMPENAMVRQASATKPATAAAIRLLHERGAFGAQGLDRRAFRITIRGVSNNGLLSVAPSPSLGDERIASISLRHLLEHEGGFDRDDPNGPGDTPLRPRTIAAALGVSSPPSRQEVINYTLGWPLARAPGAAYDYSNFGYLVLGEIIAQAWAAGYVDCLHTLVFTPDMWIPRSELEAGFTLRASRNPREPWYRGGGTGSSVFDNTPPIEQLDVNYGGMFSMPILLAHGGLVASAPVMLALGNNYQMDYPNIGTPDPTSVEEHGGALRGVQTVVHRRSDGVVLYLFINKRWVDDSGSGPQVPLDDLKTSLNALLNAGSGNGWSWPGDTFSADGYWVVPTSALPDTGLGGYDSPWRGFGAALTKADPDTRLRLRAGSTTWTGTINKRLLIDAPLGSVVLGQ